MPLVQLGARGVAADPAPLSELPVETLQWDIKGPRDRAAIKAMTKLKTLNDKLPALALAESDTKKKP